MFYSKWNRLTYLNEVRIRLSDFGPEDDRVLKFIEVYYPDPVSKEMAYDLLSKVVRIVEVKS